jgi:hypothetical protein
MGALIVTTYQVSTFRHRAKPNSHRFLLGLKGVAESGPVTEAAVFFYQSPPPDSIGHIGGAFLVGTLPEVDFASWYDILRNERPIRLGYEEGAGTDPEIVTLDIGTNQEPVGEGPKDPSA